MTECTLDGCLRDLGACQNRIELLNVALKISFYLKFPMISLPLRFHFPEAALAKCSENLKSMPDVYFFPGFTV